ncbi:hypothetical protein POM88_044222 [Heracleum sosnowskyi]|uniref:Uncharacterized protein n=1 Tax=Heracleum sosnowskyi TaxID=360622 RepID=A0AAD8M574_9APIA|nr:hypothetical protein POM88_044222 [Heracleum sosnowskyi]
MESDQRLVALKRAYADIILNISKEAAARVMASERKSQQLEHELRVTKEEAIQMMLRLKKMMDDKISEAKKTAQNQKEKIDELEAQLQEAEDIVNEVREELRDVQAKFARVTRNDVQNPDKHENATSVVAFEAYRPYISQCILNPLQSHKYSLVASEKEKSYLNQRTEYPMCPSQSIQISNSYGTKPELPSIILRSKKHNIYRNGFTQRIQACERNNMDCELPLLRQQSGVCSERKEREKTDKSICKTTTDEADKLFNTGCQEAMHKDGSMRCGYEVQTTERIPEKIKTTPKCRKTKSTLRTKNPDKLFMNVYESPGNPNPLSVKNNAQPDHDPSLTAPKVTSDKAGMANQPECAKTAEMNEDYNKGESPVDISVPIVQDGLFTEKSDIQVSEANLKKISEPVLHSEPKTTDATNGCPSPPVEKKVVIYTFQRKRKRGTENISYGNIIFGKKALAQFARQLISSERNKERNKRWLI